MLRYLGATTGATTLARFRPLLGPVDTGNLLIRSRFNAVFFPLPCRRSRVRVPSAASQNSLETGSFLLAEARARPSKARFPPEFPPGFGSGSELSHALAWPTSRTDLDARSRGPGRAGVRPGGVHDATHAGFGDAVGGGRLRRVSSVPTRASRRGGPLQRGRARMCAVAS